MRNIPRTCWEIETECIGVLGSMTSLANMAPSVDQYNKNMDFLAESSANIKTHAI
jgi:hypothetical protein